MQSEFRVGVVGDAGVGKSTLLNALLSERLPILPQGGVGPLTAACIDIRFARDPFLRVTCLGRSRIDELLQALQLDSFAPHVSRDSQRTRAARRLARLLAGVDRSTPDVREVTQSFLEACLLHSAAARSASARLVSVCSVLDKGDSADPHITVSAGLDLPALLCTLKDHAAGYLSALTGAVELGWDAPVLSDGLVLVDLPGAAVANDDLFAKTLDAVESLDALLWVVARSGVTQASLRVVLRFASALRARGLAVLPALVIAVTRLDEPVSDAMLTAKATGRPLAWREAWLGCAAQAKTLLQRQLAVELASIGDTTILELQTAIIAVQPREYQRFYNRDPDEPSRVLSAEDSGIPALIAQLVRMSRVPSYPARTRSELAVS